VIDERQYIKDVLYDWITAVVADSGRTDPVIHNNGKGPRPTPPFISLEFIGGETPGAPDYSQVKTDGTDDGEQYVSQYTRKSMTMYAFGEGAIDLLEMIKASIWLEMYINMLAKKHLVIPSALEVIENPTVRSNETENSASFDFYVTFIRVMTDIPGWIKTVHIDPPDNLPIDEITNDEEEE
jgi:hypothetical protein